jgi:hypothetical protein
MTQIGDNMNKFNENLLLEIRGRLDAARLRRDFRATLTLETFKHYHALTAMVDRGMTMLEMAAALGMKDSMATELNDDLKACGMIHAHLYQ